ncbi:nucleotidyltransferase domain-containing protein [Seonamhaeicola maritimus]|uniref:Nucleotidyltransferase domain-containing protein n=1 Tax=Seonamhaeicola maritimus TaxID=2591822 RepID=A0A5C7GH36_9FLAO|nr:nucleotidyltransferase domain-containing protein [Seonamhaeicola maritimus]TXG36976.1 nucleotidyltransferase domain-containing protein [Seonamhaeicola maritimus]
MYIYVFGSICRGEIDEFSDVDLLAIVGSNEKINFQLDTQKFSIYKEKRMEELWEEGNPFAWHLFQESKLIHSNNNEDILRNWGKPNPYNNMESDLKKFSSLFYDSLESINNSEYSNTFDLSMLFLSIRNFASCYSLGALNEFNFSRKSAINLKTNKLNISNESFSILERARILSTRGSGKVITDLEKNIVLKETELISDWFQLILKKI